MAVYITGDKHGFLYELTDFIDKFKLNKYDTVIVLGDMSLYWRKDGKDAKEFLDYYENNKYQTHIFFIDGNHENFDLLNKLEYFPCTPFKRCSEHIHYIPRGTLLKLVVNGQKKTFLACGGADSIDKDRRIKHLSWWEEEQITNADIDKCLKMAENEHIDYVLTHACPISIFKKNQVYLTTLSGVNQEKVDHTSEERLQRLMDNINFDKWFFAHYHNNIKLDDKFTCIFQNFIRLDD